jgi:hypothetical protein
MRVVSSAPLRAPRRIFWLMVFTALPLCAQTSSPPPSQATEADLEAKIQVLTNSLDQTRNELSESREEIRQLRGLLEQVIQKVGPLNPAPNGATAQMPPASEKATQGQEAAQEPAEKPAQISQDDWQVLNSRVDEQAQDKVESNLKYRLKLSGLVLFNAFGVSGQVDNLDVPGVAQPESFGSPSGAVGASLRQSILGITGFGPEILGARTSGDVQVDFFGGLPSGYGSALSGVVRLRVARVRFDWSKTSLVAGLDVPFFSPNTPTSYMSVAQPSFAASGNLWTWTPTIRLEQRLNAGAAQFKVEAGVMDPSSDVPSGSATRFPTPGETSRKPTVALRLSLNGRNEARPLSLGVSGVYFPQRYSWDGVNLTGWGSVADWRMGLIPHVEVTGEMFVGKGLDAFGGVAGPILAQSDYSNYYQSGAPDALAGITMFGGWSQLKLKINERNEFNVGLGTGGWKAEDLRYMSAYYTLLTTASPRNDTLFVNYVFRPRSDLLFSPEFRRFRTYQLTSSPAFADQVGIAAGFLF